MLFENFHQVKGRSIDPHECIMKYWIHLGHLLISAILKSLIPDDKTTTLSIIQVSD